jgi:uncharacterized protein
MWIVTTKKTLLGVMIVILAFAAGLFGTIGMFSVRVDLRKSGYIALIIDDFGNHGDGTDEMLRLGIPITVAVMPFLTHSREDADLAHQNGQEVIMHLPMEPNYGKTKWLGPRGIVADLPDQEIQARIGDGLAEINWAIGMNNHMGSKVMANRRVVKAVLEVAKEKNLIFIDSRTTQETVAPDLVKLYDLPYLGRDVFLDNVKSESHIAGQLKKLAEIAFRKGYAIGIGHVGPEGGRVTARVIKALYPELEQRGIRFVSLSQVKEVAVSYIREAGIRE